MRCVDLALDGEAIRIRVIGQGGRPVSEHIVHALGMNGSLAYVRGGPGVADAVPRGATDSPSAKRSTRLKARATFQAKKP
jgi:hypothetical protein